MTTTQIAVRVPTELLDRIEAIVGAQHGSRSDVVRRALELYLYRIDCEREASAYERVPLSDAELAVTDDPQGWKETPEW
jgi:Arc/MetJ-type ribon-helix-helix transcriptional regulator